MVEILKFLFLSRIKRSQFWWQFLVCNFSAIALSNSPFIETNMFLSYLLWTIVIILTIYQTSLIIRRCHDANISWLITVVTVILSVLPLVSLMLYIMLLYAKSSVGWNRFGPEPGDGRLAITNH